jgi:hypothetical protein
MEAEEKVQLLQEKTQELCSSSDSGWRILWTAQPNSRKRITNPGDANFATNS